MINAFFRAWLGRMLLSALRVDVRRAKVRLALAVAEEGLDDVAQRVERFVTRHAMAVARFTRMLERARQSGTLTLASAAMLVRGLQALEGEVRG